MPIPWDADILIFTWTTAKIIFGRKRRALEAHRTIPAQLEFEEVPENALTPAQRDYIRPCDLQLAALNYHPDCTYRVTNFRNYGHNLVRRYLNPTDPAPCTLTIVELKVKIGNLESVKTNSHVAFRTRFSDDKVLTTRNMSLKSLMDHPPYSIVQECRNIGDLAELKRRHDARAARMGPALSPTSGPKAIFEEKQREHRRFAEFQVQRGLYRLLPGGEAYEVTDRARLRGIWNHYNPFAKRISWTELIFCSLIGSVLPLFAILKIVPMISSPLENLQVSLVPAPWIAIAVCYVLAGAIIGMVSDRASFHWIMLISYVPAHVMAGWSFGWFPYSTLMFVTSMYVIRAKRRRTVIFES